MLKLKKRAPKGNRLGHYGGLVVILALGVGGGLVTLNCSSTKSLPAARLLTEDEGVKQDRQGVVQFDPAGTVTEARVQLPSELWFGKKVEGVGEIQSNVYVEWEPETPGLGSMAGPTVAVVPAPAGSPRVICFIGRYEFDGVPGTRRYCVPTRYGID